MRKEIARRRIDSFARSFSEAHLYLAYHAAFPLALTPDLLYRLWANFQRDISGQFLNIPWVAVVDILLSPLCEEVGQELYEMQGATRNMLLTRLEEDAKFGRERIKELSEFLIAYVRQQLHSSDPDDRDFAEAQYWTALAYVRPSDAARELALALKKAYTKDRMELLRIASVVETFAEPLAEFEPLLVYSRGMERFARGDLEGAASQLEEIVEPGSSLQFAGVNLPVPTKALYPEKITAATAGDRSSEVKLVLLNIGDGSFDKGFPVLLTIFNGNRLDAQVKGWLPANSKVPESYEKWQDIYLIIIGYMPFITIQNRGSKKQKNISVNSGVKLSEALSNALNAWLSSESFRPIREKCLNLNPSEEIRILLKTKYPSLWRLPWNDWDLLKLYPKAEVAIAPVNYELVEQTTHSKKRVRVLAILGDATGINLDREREILEELPDSEIVFASEPTVTELLTLLGETVGWDIIVFAAHLTEGSMCINPKEELSLDSLKDALKIASKRGLQLAIFNGCDGLGLLGNVSKWQIPQVITMREPTPDEVAQEFFKHFMAGFLEGKSLYLSVREAREKLKVLEDRFPFSSSLPVIIQNPAAVPPTWQSFLRGDRS